MNAKKSQVRENVYINAYILTHTYTHTHTHTHRLCNMNAKRSWVRESRVHEDEGRPSLECLHTTPAEVGGDPGGQDWDHLLHQWVGGLEAFPLWGGPLWVGGLQWAVVDFLRSVSFLSPAPSLFDVLV